MRISSCLVGVRTDLGVQLEYLRKLSYFELSDKDLPYVTCLFYLQNVRELQSRLCDCTTNCISGKIAQFCKQQALYFLCVRPNCEKGRISQKPECE